MMNKEKLVFKRDPQGEEELKGVKKQGNFIRSWSKLAAEDDDDPKNAKKGVQKRGNFQQGQTVEKKGLPWHKAGSTSSESEPKVGNRGGFRGGAFYRGGRGQHRPPFPSDSRGCRGQSSFKPRFNQSDGSQPRFPSPGGFGNHSNSGGFGAIPANSHFCRNSELPESSPGSSFGTPRNTRGSNSENPRNSLGTRSGDTRSPRYFKTGPKFELLPKPKLVGLDSVECVYDEDEKRFIYPPNFKVISPAKIKGWMIIYEKHLEGDAKKFALLLRKDAQRRGLKIRLPEMNCVESIKLEMNDWKNMFRKLKVDFDLIMILDDQRDDSHKNIKTADSLCPGIRTQHVMLHSAQAMLEADNADSLIWKFNFGCNGYNFIVVLDDVAKSVDMSKNNIMTISLVIKRSSEPGIPATIGYFFNYKEYAVGDFFFQDSTLETIDPELLKENIKNLFAAFYEKTKILPDHVVVFRGYAFTDEVEELVKNVEFSAIKEILSTFYEKSELGCQFTLMTSRPIRHFDKILENHKVEKLVPGIFIGQQRNDSSVYFWFSIDGVGLIKITLLVNETNMSLKCAQHFIYGLCALHQYDIRFEKNEPSKMVNRVASRGVQIIKALKDIDDNCHDLGNCKELTDEFCFKRFMYFV